MGALAEIPGVRRAGPAAVAIVATASLLVGLIAAVPGPGTHPAAALPAVLTPPTPAQGSVTVLNPLRSLSWDLDEAGNVVGAHRVASGEWHAFRWTEGGGVTELPLEGRTYAYAYATNDAGVVVGWFDGPSVAPSGFRWTEAGGTEALPVPAAVDVNDAGQIVTGETASILEPDGTLTDLSPWGFTELDRINDAGQVAGTGESGALLWDPVVGLIPINLAGPLVGLDEDGTVVGQGQGGWRWRPGDDPEPVPFPQSGGNGEVVTFLPPTADALDNSGVAALHDPTLGTADLGWDATRWARDGAVSRVNAAGQFAGAAILDDASPHAVRWDPDGSPVRSAGPVPDAAVVAAAAADSSAVVSWTPPTASARATSYTVELQPGDHVVTVSGLVSSTRVRGLDNGTSYDVTVVATNLAGSGPPGSGGSVVPVDDSRGSTLGEVVPTRVLDTRIGTGSTAGPLGAGETRTVALDAAGIPGHATTVVANLTVTGGTAGSYVTLFPGGEPLPLSSSVNFGPGETRANGVVLKVGSGGTLSLYNHVGAVEVILDVTHFGSDGVGPAAWVADQAFSPQDPLRIVDTRDGTGSPPAPLGPGESRTFDPSAGAAAGTTGRVVTVTVATPTAPSYLTIWSGGTRPVAASLVFPPGTTTTNLVVTGKAFTVFNAAGTVDVIVDQVAALGPAGPGFSFGLHPITPTRVLDSRTGVGGYTTAWGPGVTRDVVVLGGPLPTTAKGMFANTTVSGPTAAGYLTVWPFDPAPDPPPLTAVTTFAAGQTVGNLAFSGVFRSHRVDVFNPAGSVDVIMDATAYLAPG